MINKLILSLIISSILFGCSSKPSQKDAMGNCQIGIETAFSSGDTIRYNFPIQKQADVEILANEWCGARNKIANKSTQNCQGCCNATFRCSLK